MSNLSLLLGLEPLKKFVVGGWLRVILVLSLRLKLNKSLWRVVGGWSGGGGGWWWLRHILVFSLSLDQDEQLG